MRGVRGGRERAIGRAREDKRERGREWREGRMEREGGRQGREGESSRKSGVLAALACSNVSDELKILGRRKLSSAHSSCKEF